MQDYKDLLDREVVIYTGKKSKVENFREISNGLVLAYLSDGTIINAELLVDPNTKKYILDEKIKS